jgi:hypothetical protein
MSPEPPSWFKQRQCKAEPVGGDGLIKVSGPNLGDAYLSVRAGAAGGWAAALRLTPDGPDVAAAGEAPSPQAAWAAAFELYRGHVIC